MRIVWRKGAVASFTQLAERAPGQALAVYHAIEWLAATNLPGIGREVAEVRRRYWPVPPQGVFYIVRGDEFIVTAIRDARRRRSPWRVPNDQSR